MKVVVNDANILIDLVKLELLPQFFALGHLFYTTDIILEELYPDQVEQLHKFIEIINPRLGLPQKECETRLQAWGLAK